MPAPVVTDNRSVLQKVDLAVSDLVSDGGYLVTAQSQQFIRLLIKESKLLPMCTVVPMKSHNQYIDKIRFNDRVLKPGTEATELSAGDRSKPSTSKVELASKLVKGEVRLSNELLEDNIEQDKLRDTIMQLMGEAVARDVEDLVVNGDTGSADPFYALTNGILAAAVSHTTDAGGVTLRKGTLRDLLKALPSEYRRDKDKLTFLTSANAEIDYRDSLADRGTQFGDSHLEMMKEVGYTGIPVKGIPLFPENQTLTPGSGYATSCLLLDPKNINVGIWRQIRIETDKNISAGVVIIVVSMRLDVKYAHEDAVAKATNIKVA